MITGLFIAEINGVKEAEADSEEHGEHDSKVDVHSGPPTFPVHDVDGATTEGSEQRATGTDEDVGKIDPNGPF